MHDERYYLHYGEVTWETARKQQVTGEKRASLSVGQITSGRREVHIPIFPRPLSATVRSADTREKQAAQRAVPQPVFARLDPG